MREKKDKMSITVDPSVKSGITAMAEQESRPVSQYINLVLKYWVETDGLRNITVDKQTKSFSRFSEDS